MSSKTKLSSNWNNAKTIRWCVLRTCRYGTCPCCGHVSADNRKTQARFESVECGFEENADLVGAFNILRAGHARLACEMSDAVTPPVAGAHRSDSGASRARDDHVGWVEDGSGFPGPKAAYFSVIGFDCARHDFPYGLHDGDGTSCLQDDPTVRSMF